MKDTHSKFIWKNLIIQIKYLVKHNEIINIFTANTKGIIIFKYIEIISLRFHTANLKGKVFGNLNMESVYLFS